MNKQDTFSRHTVALCILFVLGNGIITLPLKSADEFTFMAFLLSGICLLAAYYVLCRFLPRLFKTKYLFLLPLIGVTVFSLFIGANTFLQTVRFFSEITLNETAPFWVGAVFGGTVLYFSLKQRENLFKFSLVSAILITVVIVFFFIAAADNYEIRNIFVFRLPKLGEITKQMKPYLINPLLHSLVLPFYFCLAFKIPKRAEGILGISLGLVLLGLGVLSSVLLFGPQIAGELKFSFNSAVSTVTVGRLFTRLDGFAYFVYFVCALIKITLCVDLARLCIKKIAQTVDKNGK